MPIVNGKSSISGYSGKAVKPIALRFIQQMRTIQKPARFRISGIGGMKPRRCGGVFIARRSNVTGDHRHYAVRYRIVEDMASGLSHYLADQDYSLQEMVGLANNNIVPAEDLDRSYIVYPRINLDKCWLWTLLYSLYDGGHRRMEWSEKTCTPHCNTGEMRRLSALWSRSARWVVLSLGKWKFKKGERTPGNVVNQRHPAFDAPYPAWQTIQSVC